ncbi:hypothetical protein ABK01_02780 [Treponema sp. OMZ 305]|uniref:hypothetical protein n=1 Tax=Treponema sp. OMZ 305 TaxID=1659192 RepID=UPI0021FF404B|nr:hypothetical protein ABK01_02780 [Treponema sp. OMZ 305]
MKHLEKRIADDKFSPDAAIGEIKAQRLTFSVSICTGKWMQVVGKGKACLQVLTERVTRKELIVKIPNKKPETIVKTINILEKQYKERSYQRIA